MLHISTSCIYFAILTSHTYKLYIFGHPCFTIQELHLCFTVHELHTSLHTFSSCILLHTSTSWNPHVLTQRSGIHELIQWIYQLPYLVKTLSTDLDHSKSSASVTWLSVRWSRISRPWTSMVSSDSNIWCLCAGKGVVTSWDSCVRTETSLLRMLTKESLGLLLLKQLITSRVKLICD